MWQILSSVLLEECLKFFSEAALAFGEYRHEALAKSAAFLGKPAETDSEA